MQCCVYQPRTYRQQYRVDTLDPCWLCDGESDLLILADHDIQKEAHRCLCETRAALIDYMQGHIEFAESLDPVQVAETAPEIVHAMSDAGCRVGVGPMAAVAGAISEAVARMLHIPDHDIIIENGGDIYAFTKHPLKVALYAGASPLSMKIGLVVKDCQDGMSVCTSSGSVGHSLSMGNADCVTVIARNGALADAAATALGNMVQTTMDIDRVLAVGNEIKDVRGVAIILGHHVGILGKQLELCSVGS